MIDVMKELKIEPKHYSETYYNYKDFSHVKSMENKITVETKSKQKRLRDIRKGFADADEAQEGLTYGCGEFSKMNIEDYFFKNKNSCGAKTYILHNYIFLLAVYLLFFIFAVYLSDYTKKGYLPYLAIRLYILYKLRHFSSLWHFL